MPGYISDPSVITYVHIEFYFIKNRFKQLGLPAPGNRWAIGKHSLRYKSLFLLFPGNPVFPGYQNAFTRMMVQPD